MSLPRYPAYKDSGVVWLGEVPGHWGVKRLKYSADVRLSNIDKHTVEDEPPVLLCNYVDVYKNERIDSGIEFMAATASPEQIRRLTLEVGDVIITKDSEDPRDIGVPALVSEIVPNLVCGYHLALLRPRANKIGGYIYYLFKSRYVAAAFETEATGMTRYALGKYSIENLSIPLPSAEEQQTIAAFLDRETGKIDALVAEQEQLIALLKEKRQAVISHAVTKGLYPAAKMKDSGIEWLGEVPEHWEVVPLRWRAKCSSGDGIDSLLVNESGDNSSVPVIGGNGVMGYTTKGNIEHCVLAIGRVGALCGNVHIVQPPAWISDNALVLDPDISTFDIPYLADVIKMRKLNDIASKTAQPLITGTQVKEQKLPCPPMEEQQAIATFLDAEIAKFDALTAEALRAIALLKERRSALISAAVTGKIDVRNYLSNQEKV